MYIAQKSLDLFWFYIHLFLFSVLASNILLTYWFAVAMLEFWKSRPITRKLSDRQRDERMDRHKNDPISKEPFKQSTGSNKIL